MDWILSLVFDCQLLNFDFLSQFGLFNKCRHSSFDAVRIGDMQHLDIQNDLKRFSLRLGLLENERAKVLLDLVAGSIELREVQDHAIWEWYPKGKTFNKFSLVQVMSVDLQMLEEMIGNFETHFLIKDLRKLWFKHTLLPLWQLTELGQQLQESAVRVDESSQAVRQWLLWLYLSWHLEAEIDKLILILD